MSISDQNGFAGASAPYQTFSGDIDPLFERGGDAPGDLPSYTPTQAGQQLTRGGYSLNGSGVTDTPTTISFAFRASADTMPEDATGFSQFSSTQINATLQVLQAWSDVANINFVRVDDGAGYSNDATILFGNYSAGVEGAAAFSYEPTDNATASASSDVWINTSYDYEANPGLLNYGQQTLTHEIGHSIGLQHPADYDATSGAPSYANDALYYEDSRQYTVMSYFSESDTGADFNGYYASSPLMDDIAAAQRLYGANMTTRTGNTVYGFNSTAGRDMFAATGANSAVIFCVWDAGGTDTFDFTGYVQDALIDLRAGHFSSVGGLVGNVSIALGATIEYALGGSGNDYLIGNAANNILHGGSGNDRLMGGAGNDTLNGSSGFDIADYSLETAAITFTLAAVGSNGSASGAGSDVLINIEGAIGGGGNDSLNGNEVANLLDGGAGADTLVGGLGDDTYGVDSLSDTVTELAGGGTDTIAASITYTLTDANLENLTLTGGGNINATGNADINMVSGNGGDNRIDGGAGADTLIGNLGSDTFVVDNAGDVVIERFNEGADTVEATVTWTLGSNLENLTLTGAAAIDGTGNGFDNVITGNAAANTLTGGAGNDVLDGGLGGDSLVGGIGDDLYIVDNAGDTIVEQAEEGVDTVRASRNFILAANFENLVLTGSSAINGTGNNTDNSLTGNGAANVLAGNGGNDVLDGGAGADTLNGGLGDDSFYVDNAGDAVVEVAGQGVDTVFSAITFSLAGSFADNIILTGAADLNGTGNGLDNLLTGNSGANTLTGGDGNDVLDGGGGIDSLVGGLGDDVFLVDNAADAVVEAAGGGTDTIVAALTYDLTGTQIENLTLTGAANLNGTGNAFDNVLIGNIGNNILLGGAGNDTLNGGDTTSGDIVDDGSVRHDTMATAMAIKSDAYNVNDNPFIIDPTVVPHATIVASGDDTYRWYSITVRAGCKATFDIDATIAIDTQLRLYDHYGNLLELADDSWDGQGEGGSTTSFDSYLEYTFATAGVYYIEISEYGHGVVMSGESYQLNISLDRNGSFAGNDSLDGGTGADNMAGGYGNDTYIVDNAGDVVTEAYNSGSDLVQSTVSYTLTDYVEKLVLIGGNLNGTGSAQNNTITGTDGNNRLDGGAGSDTLVGGKGNDTYVIDNSNDVIVEAFNEGIDLVLASATYTGQNAYIDNITLTGSGNAGATGNQLDNIILGNNGNNVLRGGAGNDSLTGGEGNDSLEGGAGNDTLNGGNGDDTYIIDQFDTFSDSGGVDTIVSSRNYTLGAGYENLTLGGASNISGVGNSVANIITGNNGNNSLDGAGGVDTLIGHGGDDTYIIDSAAETIVEAKNEGIDTVFAGFSYTLSPTQHVDNLTLTGAGNFLATGNGLANVLRGNSGSNLIDGMAGADIMIGGAGNDTYIVDNVGDVISEVAGGVDAGGNDLVSASVSHTLGLFIERLTLTGAANISGTGNAMDNAIIGNSGSNRIDGGLGADTMGGGAGNDTYIVDNAGDAVREYSDQGIDTVISSVSFDFGTQHIENLTLTGSGNLTGTGNGLVNILTGNGGNNVLDGRQGADTLYGGAGNDTYYVDNAGDRVYETTASATDAGGVDTVIALVRVTLSNFVENLILGGTANLTGTGNSLDNMLTGNDGINSLSGQAGNDIIDGGLGADLMVGGLGDDTYYIDNAGDKILESSGQGTDTVFSSVTFNTGSQYIEIVTLTGSDAINANGNTLANTLNGNDAVNKLDGGAGDDTLNGGGGNDLLVGGSGADLYVFGANSGADIISGFLAAQNDRIDLHAISAGTVNGGGVTISQSGADTLIDLGGGNTVTILNTTATDANFLSHIVW